MKIALSTCFILITLSSFSQPSKNFIDQNYIEVTGTAEMEVIPDEIYLTIWVRETDKPKRTVEEGEKILVERLTAMGVAVKTDLTVLDFLSSAKSGFLSRDVVTSKKYQLLLHDAKETARVFNDLEANGFTNISVSKLDHSRIEEFRQQVKANAIKAAKEKAGMLMQAIGPLVRILERHSMLKKSGHCHRQCTGMWLMV
jgi:uncharacterized protein YggE